MFKTNVQYLRQFLKRRDVAPGYKAKKENGPQDNHAK